MKLFKKFWLPMFSFLFVGVVFAGSYGIEHSMNRSSMGHTMMQHGKTIAQIVASNSKFSTLKTALQKTGLDTVLNTSVKYTVFAPTNAAFANLPKGTLSNLMKPDNLGQLKDILLYHVVKGKVMSQNVRSGKVKTLEGSDLNLKVDNGEVTINDQAKVSKADINASNGVIHAIDQVLMPPKS